MTAVFRIDAVELDTDEGTVRYEFPSDLTVLAGQPASARRPFWK